MPPRGGGRTCWPGAARHVTFEWRADDLIPGQAPGYTPAAIGTHTFGNGNSVRTVQFAVGAQNDVLLYFCFPDDIALGSPIYNLWRIFWFVPGGNLASVTWQLGSIVFDPGVTSYNGATVVSFATIPQTPGAADLCMMRSTPGVYGGGVLPANNRQGLMCLRRQIDTNNAVAHVTGVSHTVGIQ